MSVPSTSKNAPRSQVATFCRLAPPAEEAQERDEEVHEVEVERERAVERETVVAGRREGADALRVVGGEAAEHEDPHAARHENHRVRAQEDVHHGSEYDPDEADEEEMAPAGEVALGERPVGAHRRERASGDEEGGGERLAGEGE